MIIMEKNATTEQIQKVVSEVRKSGLRADVSKGKFLTIIGLIGDESRVSFSHLATFPGVKQAESVETPYKLISRDYSQLYQKEESHTINIKDITKMSAPFFIFV